MQRRKGKRQPRRAGLEVPGRPATRAAETNFRSELICGQKVKTNSRKNRTTCQKLSEPSRQMCGKQLSNQKLALFFQVKLHQ